MTDRFRQTARGLLAAALAATAPALAAAPAAAACPPAGAYDSGGAPGASDPNDPLYGQQWGLDQINAPEGWARGARGAGVVIAVVDSGVDLGHPDLQAHLVPGTDFVPPQEDNCPGPQDENGHGTHVAGIAAAVTNNGTGVAGAARDSRIMPVRVLNADGEGSFDAVADAIRYSADNGARVVNLSLGLDIPVLAQTPLLFQDVEAAVEYAWSKGAVVVGAAGNETTPACGYPSAAEHAVCVAATGRFEDPTFYSNFPLDDDRNGFRAPGGDGSDQCEDPEFDVWSTIWPASEEDCKGPGQPPIDGYETLAGTSMAAPHVSGVAAMLLSTGMTNAQVVECLKRTSRNPVTGARGEYEPTYGWGIVDADEATRRCSTAGISGAPGPVTRPVGGHRGDVNPERVRVSVRLLGDDLRRVIRRRRVRFRLRAGERLTMSMAATMRAARRSQAGRSRVVLGRKKFVVRRRGTRRGTVRLTRAGARALRRRGSPVRITLRFRAEDRRGNVRSGRRARTFRRR